MTEAILCVYGIPNMNYQIISKEAALSVAEQAKAQGKIQDYRVEGGDKDGKIVAILAEPEDEELAAFKQALARFETQVQRREDFVKPYYYFINFAPYGAPGKGGLADSELEAYKIMYEAALKRGYINYAEETRAPETPEPEPKKFKYVLNLELEYPHIVSTDNSMRTLCGLDLGAYFEIGGSSDKSVCRVCIQNRDAMQAEPEPASPERSSNEKIYDEQVAPLMAQIIEICKEHKIPFLASFQMEPENDVDGEYLATSAILPKDCKTILKRAVNIINFESPVNMPEDEE